MIVNRGYERIIREALHRVVSEQGYTSRDIHEVALAHRLAYHLETSGCFTGYMVDCEYNRNGRRKKRDDHGRLFRSDIVIHVRGNSDNNLIMIEAKKFNSADERETTKKELRSRKETYCYEMAFLVTFPENNEISDDSVIEVAQ